MPIWIDAPPSSSLHAGLRRVLQPSIETGPLLTQGHGSAIAPTSYAITEAADRIRTRFAGDKAESEGPTPPIVGAENNSLDYLAAVMRGKLKPEEDATQPLTLNMIVVQILAAARESAKSGRTIPLHPLPK